VTEPVCPASIIRATAARKAHRTQTINSTCHTRMPASRACHRIVADRVHGAPETRAGQCRLHARAWSRLWDSSVDTARGRRTSSVHAR
jgi:hypothetical protein